MYLIKETKYFSKWLLELKNIIAKVSILRRIDRMKNGNFGEHKGIGNSISELKITTGAGYRIYYQIKKNEIIILLIGGNKSTQKNEIKKAKEIAKEL